MYITDFNLSIHDTVTSISKSQERLVQYTDGKQYLSAALELGRLQELGKRLTDLSRIMYQDMWTENEQYIQNRIREKK